MTAIRLLLSAALVLVACSEPIAEPPSPDAGSEEDAGILRTDTVTLTPFDDVRISSHSSDPNFQNAYAELDWGEEPKRSVTLFVELATTCYPFTSWAENPPPQGQNWPADCDAYDRNFELVLDPAKEPGDTPGIELVRAITPFGGPMSFEVDLTDLANGLPGSHTLQVHITTWSDAEGKVSGSRGGWNVTARLEIAYGEPPRRVVAVRPLFNGSVTAAGDSTPIFFEVPEGVVRSRIEYRATGHGGGPADGACIGHADEFCRRVHTLQVDGRTVSTFTPWRDDCADLCTVVKHVWPSGSSMDYCLENPCGSMASVRAPRANWCPGSITPPVVFAAPELLVEGEHRFAWNISKIADGGSWRISAHWIGYGP